MQIGKFYLGWACRLIGRPTDYISVVLISTIHCILYII